MSFQIDVLQHDQIAGTSLEPLTTTFVRKLSEGTRLIAGSIGKKVEDWTIRSQDPKPVKQGHGEGSETRWLWV